LQGHGLFPAQCLQPAPDIDVEQLVFPLGGVTCASRSTLVRCSA
jgi:hypothetical protein